MKGLVLELYGGEKAVLNEAAALLDSGAVLSGVVCGDLWGVTKRLGAVRFRSGGTPALYPHAEDMAGVLRDLGTGLFVAPEPRNVTERDTAKAALREELKALCAAGVVTAGEEDWRSLCRETAAELGLPCLDRPDRSFPERGGFGRPIRGEEVLPRRAEWAALSPVPFAQAAPASGLGYGSEPVRRQVSRLSRLREFLTEENGPDLLSQWLYLHPVERPGVTACDVRLPKGVWVHLWTGKVCTGACRVPAPPGSPPLFYRSDCPALERYQDFQQTIRDGAL